MRRIITLFVFAAGVAALAWPQSVDVVPRVETQPPVVIDTLPQLPPPLDLRTSVYTPSLTVVPPVQAFQPRVASVATSQLSVVANYTLVNVHLEGFAGQSTYVAKIGASELIRTVDASRLVAAIAQRRGSATGPVYIDTAAMDANRRAAIRTTIDNSNRDQHLPLHYVDGLDVLFTSGAERQDLTITDSGKDDDGYYYERADVTVSGTSFTMTVFSRVKAAAHALMSMIASYFGQGSYRSSTIAVVNTVRRHIATTYAIPEGRLYVEIKDQLSNSRWVELRRPSDLGAR